jgi:hypothetical protein
VSPDPVTDAATAVVALHLRELPSTALEALMDLITSGGPQALVFAITEELASRHPQHFSP